MKKICLITLLLFTFIACEKQSEIELTNPLVLKDGLLYIDSTSTKPFTGRHKSKMLNMKIEYEVKDGIKNGDFILYNSNDKAQIVGKMIDNKNEGIWKYYYPNGNLESEGFFSNDTVDGYWKWYDSRGLMIQEGNFNSGLKEGEWKIYDSSGKVRITYTYSNDKLIDSLVVDK